MVNFIIGFAVGAVFVMAIYRFGKFLGKVD